MVLPAFFQEKSEMAGRGTDMEEMLRSEKLEFTYTIEEEDGTVAASMVIVNFTK